MAQKLLVFYELADKEGGLVAKMRLAMKTNIPSTKAASEPDTPENLAKFTKAFKELFGKEPSV